jgi:hypothetical protein
MVDLPAGLMMIVVGPAAAAPEPEVHAAPAAVAPLADVRMPMEIDD